MRPVVLALLLSTAPAVWSQTAGEGDAAAADLIAECAETASEDTIGLADLEAECPGLTLSLQESGYLALLSAGQRDKLQYYHLLELQQLGSRYREPATERIVDVETLGSILGTLREQRAERPLTWYERFKRWLRELLERRQSDSDSWLARWLDTVELSDAVARAIVYTSIVAIIVLALGVVLNELRVAGLLRRRRRAGDAGSATLDLDSGRDAAGDFDDTAAAGKAPALLRMLVATLVRSGRLRAERSLTHRELCTRAKFDNARQRECFQRVAQLAERAVYGGGAPSEDIEPIAAAAHDLNEQLSGAAA